uniref:Putative nucleoporin n=1 Tax=Trypanosoma vivax (strain Y486) TaxID=1055687 RepID=G0U7A1_TRYVY|nr:putative nucleoporin [Trypanosoma vivax Y486]
MATHDHGLWRVEDATKKAVEEMVNAEIQSSTINREINPSASGRVTSHPFALNTFDTSFTLPAFLPVASVSWPDPVKALWRAFKANSIVGLFSELSRAWITVDNKLLLWNFGTGREFVVYDEIPELIIAVGNPIAPAAGVFQPHITNVFPVATPKTLHLLGLCVVGEKDPTNSELHVVNLGFSVASPTLFTKLVGARGSGRVFAAGADGDIYELKYTRENTALLPKIRLVNHSLMFGNVPVLGAVSSALSAIRQAWAKQKPALRDLVIEEDRNLLFTLDAASTIILWKITDGGLKLLSTTKQSTTTFGYNRLSQSAGGEGHADLMKIFCVTHNQNNHTLIAIASNGDQYRYACQSGLWSGAETSLTLLERVPAYISSGREVNVCFVSGDITVLCHTEKGEERSSSDLVTVATSHRGVLPPHRHCRDIVTQFEPAVSHMIRVDAIDEVPMMESTSPNELCSQILHSPGQLVFLHRHGVSTYMRLRPVDTLHMIIVSASQQTRGGLLQRFASIYTAADYCCMLLQIAVGCTNIPSFLDGPYIQKSTAGFPLCQTDKNGGTIHGSPSMSQLGHQLMEATSQEAQRLAREILRSAMAPSWHEAVGSDSDARQIVVQVSPFAQAVLTFIGRTLHNVWNSPIENLQLYELALVEVALSSLIRLLNSLKKDVWSDIYVQPKMPFHWDQGRITLTFPSQQLSVSPYDLKMLQSSLLCASHSLCERVLQTIKFIKQTSTIPFTQDDDRLTIAQIVRDQAVAHHLARYVGEVVLYSEHGAGFLQKEHLSCMTLLQSECPYFFSTVDVQEFAARVKLEHILSANRDSLCTSTESEIEEWESSISGTAASLWSSGALLDICQQLKALRKEEIVVRLLLRASSQLDTSNTMFGMYLAERNGVPDRSVSPAVRSVFRQKVKALEYVIATIEDAWETHRGVVDDLLGGPMSSGTIWQVEPSDEMAHCFIFDWMCAPRKEASIVAMLRDTLVAARSPFLESYLKRNVSTLGEQYAHYLRKVKKNYNGAIEVCAAMAQAPLLEAPREERISYRLRCWMEAKECAEECSSDQLKVIEQHVGLMEAQLQLSKIIHEFINSGLPQLDRQVMMEGRGLLTERQVAMEQLEVVESQVLSTFQLLETAGMFCVYGGAEIQLDVLSAANVSDASLYAACIERCFQRRNSTVEDIARRVIGKCMRTIVTPLCHVVKILEAYAFNQSPDGSTFTVDLLSDCGVECTVIFSTLAAIVDRKDSFSIPCEAFERAGVTDAFLVHSLVTALHRALFASHTGSVHMYFFTDALHTAKAAVSKVSHCKEDEHSISALAAATRLLEQCHFAAARAAPKVGY